MPKFSVSKRVTVPTFRLPLDVPVHLFVVDKIRTGKRIKDEKDKDGQKRAPARVVRVIDMESGQTCDLVCPVVLASIWEDEIGEYAHRTYRIVKHAPEDGKSYSKFSVDEVDVTFGKGETDPRDEYVAPKAKKG